jgi:hypothetical protein
MCLFNSAAAGEVPIVAPECAWGAAITTKR